MALALHPFDGLPLFLADFSLQVNQGAALFARSARTLRRWRRRGLVPQSALDLVRVIREQRAPLSASFARDQRAATPAWSARLARPRPLSRRRARLVNIARGYAANGWTERAAEALREAWPTSSSGECSAAARELVDQERGRRAAAIERLHQVRDSRRVCRRRRRHDQGVTP